MYLAVGAVILGQAVAVGQPVLLAYLAPFAVAVAAFVHWYEEPTLRKQFGASYAEYQGAVPRWLARRTAWQPPEQSQLTVENHHRVAQAESPKSI